MHHTDNDAEHSTGPAEHASSTVSKDSGSRPQKLPHALTGGRSSATTTPFDDVTSYVALRRQRTIALSPDGSRLIATAGEPDPEGTRYVSALWEIDQSGALPARRLTRSETGDGSPAIGPDNSVLFVSKRRGGQASAGKDSSNDDSRPSLWRLPAGPGEARQVAEWDGGIGDVRVARQSGRIVITATAFERTATSEADADKRARRRTAKVSAILHSGYPVRHWDHDLGAEQPRLLAANWTVGPGNTDTARGAEPAPADGAAETARLALHDLTPHAGRALADSAWDVSADGRFVVAEWQRVDGHTELAAGLVRIDVPSGEQTVLHAPPRAHLGSPTISPDGAQVACVRMNPGTTDTPHTVRLCTIPATGGECRDWPLDGDLRPSELAWAPDGSTLYLIADQAGRAPVFALDMNTGNLRRLVRDGAYSSLQVHPDGRTLLAVRSSYVDPGTIVILDAAGTDQDPQELPGPAPRPALPGTLSELATTAEDGTEIRSYLAVPESASADDPAPLLLWVHGGPVSSWNAWSWRWCPWVMVAHGYAVLLPDPALSTGYGDGMIRRGWGRWGAEPFTDVLAAADGALAERTDLDPDRTAMMGGSFGGYMANWIAGHTDRFRAIVTHASLWDLPAFGGTTDAPSFWRDEMSPEMAAAYSPSSAVADIRTPMLVIHGDKDYRVPIGEGLRLWWDLLAAADPDEPLPHRFLYFPDENHWVLTPNHAAIWYETVLAFLAWHVLGDEFRPPDLL